MSHGQPNKPQLEDFSNQEPIKYGDVFKVTGDLATELISPHDAATMTAAETRILGQPQRGSPAAVMQAAAAINEASVLVGRHGMAEMAKDHGITVIETTTDGHRIISEAVDGQILGRRVEPDAPTSSAPAPMNLGSAAIDGDPISIGEALEAAALSVGDKVVDQNDADAISVAEIRATGEKNVRPGGVGESAQSAANLNSRVTRREDMAKLSDVLTDAAEKLGADKAVTKEDAEAVHAAEVHSDGRELNISEPGGVAASMATAAKLNQETI